jgi:hypothetical protein
LRTDSLSDQLSCKKYGNIVDICGIDNYKLFVYLFCYLQLTYCVITSQIFVLLSLLLYSFYKYVRLSVTYRSNKYPYNEIDSFILTIIYKYEYIFRSACTILFEQQLQHKQIFEANWFLSTLFDTFLRYYPVSHHFTLLKKVSHNYTVDPLLKPVHNVYSILPFEYIDLIIFFYETYFFFLEIYFIIFLVI